MAEPDEILKQHRATEYTLQQLKALVESLAALIDSGRLKVDTSGVVLTADIVEADMDQVTGESPANATLYDLETLLTALFYANGGQSATASSGVTATTTSDDSAVTAIAADDSQDYHHLRVINEGSASGFFTPDGGTTWHRLPAFSVVEMQTTISNLAVQVKRVAGGDNLSGVYASVW